MSRDYNKITFTGRLGRDVEIKYTPAGIAVATFSVASNHPVKDETEQSGWRDETEWFRVVAWRDLAERMSKNLTKGTRVLVEGRIETQVYTDKQGQQQKSVQVVANDYMLLEKKHTVTDDSNQESEDVAPEDIPF